MPPLQILLIVILSIALLAAIVSFAVMGTLQHRRSAKLARWASSRGLRFSESDVFEIPLRYASFAVIGSGHSPCAHNLTYGHLGELPLRAFDFHYEVGHGTQRMTRRYSIVLLSFPQRERPLLMWRSTDFAPLAAPLADGAVDSWMYIGDRLCAQKLARACAGLDAPGSCIQVQDSTIVFAMPGENRRFRYDQCMDEMLSAARAAGIDVPQGWAPGASVAAQPEQQG